MEYKLSNIIKKLNERDYLGHIMIRDYRDQLQLRYHIMPSYGYADPEEEDTPEWFDSWWRADIEFDKKTGIVDDAGFFNNSFSGTKVGDKIIIDCDYTEYLVEA